MSDEHINVDVSIGHLREGYTLGYENSLMHNKNYLVPKCRSNIKNIVFKNSSLNLRVVLVSGLSKDKETSQEIECDSENI